MKREANRWQSGVEESFARVGRVKKAQRSILTQDAMCGMGWIARQTVWCAPDIRRSTTI